MEAFAKSKNLDPLLPETWSKISPKEFLKLKVEIFFLNNWIEFILNLEWQLSYEKIQRVL